MKKNYQIFMLLMVFGIASLLTINSAYAACAGSVSFGQPTYCVYGGPTGTYSPGTQFQLDVSLFGEWWALGSGDATVGLGNDRGTHVDGTTASWLSYFSNYCHYMNAGIANWFNAGTDGCILLDAEEGPMVASFDDKKADNSTAFFAVGCVARTGGPDYNFDRVGGGMYLTEIPAISIDSSSTATPGQVDLTLSWADASGGFYSAGDAGCTWANVLSAYEIYYYQGASAPTTRDAASWTSVADTDGDATNLGATVSIPDPVTSGHSSWLALRLAYDSGFKSRYVGPNSSQVAGPTAAGGFESVAATHLGKKDVRIDWVTNAEFNVSGFNILRADNPEGPFAAVSGLIAPTGVGGAGDSYTFVDTVKGIGGTFTFYYKVEMVASGDAINVQSGIVSATLKEKAPQGPKPKGR